MFIYNIKLNKMSIFKIFFIIAAIVMLILFSISVYKIINSSLNSSRVLDEDNIDSGSIVDSKNYTNILKEVHENLDDYIGQTITITGYVYKLYDFKNNQFVIARDMVISSDFQTVVVGFLCEYNEKNIKNVSEGNWIKINARITKGNYHGEMPILQVLSAEKQEKPADEYVYPPDDSYIPTSVIY